VLFFRYLVVTNRLLFFSFFFLMKRRPPKSTLSSSSAASDVYKSQVLYACGLPWLAVFVGPSKALSLGLFPFLPGDLVKVILAAFALPSLWAVIPTARIRPTTNPTDDQSDQ